jgi:DNA repair photolyase
MDIWDGLICPYACIYCYANSFRASLYTAFFDNSKTMGLRHCNPTYYKQEMDKMARYRAMTFDQKKELTGINKAFALRMPVRMGIRFEDFLRNEGRHGISLEMLRYLKDIEYPVMINTKSNLVGTDPYIRALADNKAGGAVHLTVITSNEEISKKLEPGAPSYALRLEAIRNMTSAGVRVVARIEPYLFLLNDDSEDVLKYIEDMWEAGVRNITFDTYSYTAGNSGIRQSFINVGYDYDRMFMAGADSQPFGSLLLGKFMEVFRERGFSCSTFDMGNNPTNDQSICCEVEDFYTGGWNFGCTVMAARFIKSRKGESVDWKNFEHWVDINGGFLTEELRQEVKRLWNLEGNVAYSHRWAAGMIPCGRDEDGLIWKWMSDNDYRETLIQETYEDNKLG